MLSQHHLIKSYSDELKCLPTGNVNHLYKSKYAPVMLMGIQNLIFALQKSIYIKERMVAEIHNATTFYLSDTNQSVAINIPHQIIRCCCCLLVNYHTYLTLREFKALN